MQGLNQSDIDLFKRARGGEQTALDELLRKCFLPVFQKFRRWVTSSPMRSLYDSTKLANDVWASRPEKFDGFSFVAIEDLIGFWVWAAGRRVVEACMSPALEARLALYREEWLRVGTCTAPADRPRAEAAIARVYNAIGEGPPCFLWCDSPPAALRLMRRMGRPRLGRFRLMRRMGRPRLGRFMSSPILWVFDLVMQEICDPLLAMLRLSHSFASRFYRDFGLSSTLMDLGQSSGFVLNIPAREFHEVPMFREVDLFPSRMLSAMEVRLMDEGVRASRMLDEDVLGAVRRPEIGFSGLLAVYRGQHDTDRIATALFYRDELGARGEPGASEALDRWVEIARSCFWWWPYRGLCVACDRPEGLHLAGGRLHNDAGPAVRFRDGWSVWAIGGVRVDEQVVLHPETQTIKQIRREPNAEAKRVRIERFGWQRYLSEAGAAVIDRCRNDIEATRETLLRLPGGETVLLCACPSTARVYALEVPADVRTCAQAQAWLSGGLAGRIINGA
jgi:hypothetical protein